MTSPQLGDLTSQPVLSEQDKKTLILPTDPWADSRAHAIVLADYKKAEMYRMRAHDRRYRTSDELWVAWRQQKTWDGTKIPRASMGIFLSLEQIMALIPRVVNALFGDDRSFEVRPWQDGTLAQAQAVYELLRYQLSDIGKDGLISFREIMNRGFHQMFQYGNMVAEFAWDRHTEQRVRLERYQEPVRVPVYEPTLGQMVPMSTGEMRSGIRQIIDQRKINRPLIQNIDLRDFYPDPNCPSPNIQEGSYACTRHWRTIEWLRANCQTDGGFINFSDAQLIELANTKTHADGDTSKQHTEMVRGNHWMPGDDQSADPMLRQMEVIRYFQKGRTVWLLNRQLFYNQPSEYGCIPFVSMGNIPVQGRWHSLSICDLVEGDQRLMEAIINARLDELNLAIHPPIVKPLGMKVSNTQRKLRPGVEWEVEDMKQMPQKMEFGQANPQAFIEIEASDRRVQKITGNSDLVALGSPSAGGNSANRTAAGIQVQQQATNTRTEYLVENIEDQFMVPLLTALLAMNQAYLDPMEMAQIVGQDGSGMQLDPLDVMNASVKFEMLAASKMRSRAQLSQILPWFMQTLLNPALMPQLYAIGVKPKLDALMTLLAQTGNFKLMQLFEPVTPEDMARLAQPSPDKAMDATMQTDRLVSAEKMKNMDAEAKLALGIIKELLKDPAVREKLTGIAHSEKVKLEMPPPSPAAKK